MDDSTYQNGLLEALKEINKRFPIKVNFENSQVDKLNRRLFNKMLSLSRDGKTISLNKSFFIDRAVPNVWRYTLVWDKCSWKLIEPLKDGKTLSKEILKSNFNDVNISPSAKNILLILESPHKDEYDPITFEPLAPANKASGNKIRDQFEKKVLPYLIGLGLKLNKKIKFNLCILNPVPYQTSLHQFRKLEEVKKPKLDDFIRDVLWCTLYDLLEDHFVVLTKETQGEILICACTGGQLSKKGLNYTVVQTIKDKIKPKQLFITTHPSSWKLPEFEKIESV